MENKTPTIEQIVEQLTKCDFQCEAGDLANNTAFLRLKEMAKSHYQNKFIINDEVYYQGKKYFIRGYQAVSSSHPKGDIEYNLSKEFNRPCTSNLTECVGINENQLISIFDYEEHEINKAKELLKSKGITTL